ncbi:dynamin family protein [Candidatus Parabeggiatoa sp. HSG14]|uniref:dynamin family protein n=1 Tax=Candidatus Parabeggiatoa sp. HSG14 TaxID=3055593 RepID=UPI0025A6A555|nr:dynamin family protein [Thiotrichales bacterium HSG14]
MPKTQLETRLNNLKEHLKEENDLHEIVEGFRELDRIAYKLGLLGKEDSYATNVSWWPMISVLGTYSAGKSSFVNHYLGMEVQRTGTQAVDEKFTVICFSEGESTNTLPGLALDADPRFPFYQISHDIAEITKETDTKATLAQRVDAYLQLKTCPSEHVRGKIVIDSPGFDADSQRTSTLSITRHIIDLSDLVLVFFDARHPEPGAMRDTLQHLVSEIVGRPDSSKFVFILNQMDITAQEDNPEEVVAAWQRSLAQAGLTAGDFYRIYNPKASVALPDHAKNRFEKKCKADTKEIHARMEQVGVERAYRVVGMLEHTAKDIKNNIVPQLQNLVQRWKKRTFWTKFAVDFVLIALVGLGIFMTGTGSEISTKLLNLPPMKLGILGGIFVIVVAFLHIKIAKGAANKIQKQLQTEITDESTRETLSRAFRKNTSTLRALFIWFIGQPAGWSNGTQKRINNLLGSVDSYVQKLNNRFTNPSGKADKTAPSGKADKAATQTKSSTAQKETGKVQPTPVTTTEK